MWFVTKVMSFFLCLPTKFGRIELNLEKHREVLLLQLNLFIPSNTINPVKYHNVVP